MKKDTYATPQPVFDYLNREFNFDIDVCAEDYTAKCYKYYTAEMDAFKKNWSNDGKICWCNPPYSNITPWVQKAISESYSGVTTVMLVMCDTSVGWFNLARKKASEIRFITGGRLSFDMDGIAQSGNNKGSLIFVFRPNNNNAHVSFINRDEFYGNQ